MEWNISPNIAVQPDAMALGAADVSEKPAASPVSHAANKCSVPKNDVHIIESSQPEKQTEPLSYEQRLSKCKSDLATMTAKALKHTYLHEYRTWGNCKHRAKDLKGITGPLWGTELDAFSGFLGHVGPKPNLMDSMDRIDPEYGYVVGNLRWASKQLQSENRQNVRVYVVNGKPMNLRQVAEYLGMSYDALRMQLHRGKGISDLVANHVNETLNVGDKTAVAKAQKVEASPWPKGREKDWEACFRAEKVRLLQPSDQGSRTAFFVAKCSKEWWRLNKIAVEYAEENGMKSNYEYEKQMRYWALLHEYARSQQEIVKNARGSFKYCVGPTDYEFEEVEKYFGPVYLTDED